ncbi:sirohydrochlorin chelatase [Tindallia californiensis]|uniref:Sirohydrochlorin cobaltochelatase n=1 Tax=Tindallia californiensis TaxID=159292 RepID=A0A1H3PJH5_9FIRM|nr:CbiX/SirB N-terminal domain-containing protein [Tindallia californiensis]SDZ01123.1 sirohydrochlorin cobaltochelatase [Tindallia californiensis]
MKKALLILAHGSRVPETCDTVKKLAEAVKEKSEGHFPLTGYGFLQFAKPTFEEAAEKLIQEGAEEMVVSPFFLFAGHHMQHDLPEAIEALQQKYPKLTFKTTDVIGDDPRMADILLDQIQKVK